MRHVYVPRFDWHIAGSSHTAGEILQAGGSGLADRVFVIPMGVDADLYSSGRRTAAARAYLQGLIHGGGGAALLVYAGRLSRQNRLSLLIDAMAALPDTAERQYRLVIAGSGPLATDLIREAGQRCPGRIAFLGHLRTAAELANLYANCDAFVHPNSLEQSCTGVLEAMAAGLPVVAPLHAPALPFLDAGNAWLEEPEGRLFAAAIQDLFSAAELRERRVAKAFEAVEDYRWPRVSTRLFDLYDQFMVRARRAPPG
jgi:alpha-1,6-mannosyltransferase